MRRGQDNKLGAVDCLLFCFRRHGADECREHFIKAILNRTVRRRMNE